MPAKGPSRKPDSGSSTPKALPQPQAQGSPPTYPTGSRTHLKKLTYATILAAPNKQDKIDRLIAIVDTLEEENRSLKARLSTLETQVQILTSTASSKVTEEGKPNHVEAKLKQDNGDDITAKVKKCVITELRERQLQAKNALRVRIGGLPPGWDSDTETYNKCLTSLNKNIKPIVIKQPYLPETICPSDTNTPDGQAILVFKNKDDRLKLLQQARLLKGTKIWLAEELTPSQLKSKGADLKKVKEARTQGKWAIYRGGRAIIQEFHTPKPSTAPLDPPP